MISQGEHEGFDFLNSLQSKLFFATTITDFIPTNALFNKSLSFMEPVIPTFLESLQIQMQASLLISEMFTPCLDNNIFYAFLAEVIQ